MSSASSTPPSKASPIAGGRLDEGQLGRGRLEVVAHKAGVVPIARRVDADAKATQWRSGRCLWYHGTLGKGVSAPGRQPRGSSALVVRGGSL
jgi:hypothetical protein